MQDVIARLDGHYREANRVKFDGVLPARYRIAMNPLLRRWTGRITYGERLIEISAFHFRTYGYDDAVATLEHEMLHLYLHCLGLPSGHNALFKELAARLGIRVFHANPYPRNRPPRDRYLYECPSCQRLVFRKRLTQELACGVCCRVEAAGDWDDRFQLRLVDRVRMA